MRKNHLRLVVNNRQTKIQKFWQWINKPRFLKLPALPFVVTEIEKEEVVRNYLTLKYANYQATTGDVDLFPLSAAINEVQNLKQQNRLNSYYKKIKRLAK